MGGFFEFLPDWDARTWLIFTGVLIALGSLLVARKNLKLAYKKFVFDVQNAKKQEGQEESEEKGKEESKSEPNVESNAMPAKAQDLSPSLRHDKFDVFLSHNSKDKSAVIQIAEELKVRGLRVWLDEWELVPGRPWQEALEEIIETVRSSAVLVGKDGIGPWENQEMRACLNEFVNRGSPVIPVLLPEAAKTPKLPLFLAAFTWVDLRQGLTQEGLDRLQWGVTGKKPQTP